MKKTRIAAALIALVAIGALVFFFTHRPPAPPPPDPRANAASVAAEGKVEAMPGYDVDVSSGELNGKVDRILVKEGETVRAGQLVAIMQNDDLKAAVQRAEGELRVARSKLAEVRSGARTEEIGEATAAWEGARAVRQEAESQLRRYRELRAQGMVSSATLDERQRAYDAARAAAEQAEQRKRLLEAGPRAETLTLYENQVRLAEAALAYNRRLLEKTYVRSPIVGTVIQRYLDEGEGVTPEIPILGIADLERIWLNVEVDETDIGTVNVGDAVEVTSDAYRGRKFKGRVRQISDYAGSRKIRPSNPAVNLGLKVVQVKIELLEKTPLRLGMTVDVKIATGRPAG
jgi:ABC exporter DevB family membrane fusion protein